MLALASPTSGGRSVGIVRLRTEATELPFRDWSWNQGYVKTEGQSASLSGTHVGPMARFLLLSDSCEFVDVERLLWREDTSVV
jgi:hypothetical protein